MGACSSVPSETSLPKLLWDTFGAVPVLPFPPNLTVFSVLVKDAGGSFWRIGDLGSLCAGQGKADLQNLIANTDQSITMSEELGLIDRLVANDSGLSSRLLVFDTGFAAALSKVHTWRISVPSHQRLSADQRILDTMLDRFIPDSGNRHFAGAGNRKMDVWIVTEVITAPSVSVFALNREGGSIRLNLPPLPSLPANLDIGLGGHRDATEFFIRRGAEMDGTVRPLPFAFRGWKFQYKNGRLTKPRPARYESDSLNPIPLNGAAAGPEHQARAATPLNDPDMVDLVVGNEWVTTILDDLEKTTI